MPRIPFVRNTFGLIDKNTGKRYDDILVSHLELRRISFDDWFVVGRLAESKDRQKEYTLLLDHKTKKELCRTLIVDALVSFQIRKDGKYAVARLWDASRKNNIITSASTSIKDTNHETI